MMKRRDILTGLFFALIGGLVVPVTAEEMQLYKTYEYEEIQDAAMGKVVARCMIPSGYTAAGQVMWCGQWQSAGAPAQVYITALSPDQNTVMGFYSYVVYEHKLEDSMSGVNYTQHRDGIFDAETMTPMLHFMEAEDYCDYLAEGILSGYQIELIEKHTVADELDQAVAMLMDARKAEISELEQMFAVSGFLLEGTYAGLAEQSYRVVLDEVPYRMTVLCTTDGIQFGTTQEMLYVGTVRSAFISWEAPFAFFMLTPESEYEEHAAAFEQFIWNTELTDQFVEAFQKAQDQIVKQILQNGSTSMSTVQDYCESSVSDAMGSGATYDAEQFSDYILSQNDYTMPDGEHVKVSNTFDYVYADDLGNLYVSNTQEQPAGTTQLHPN